MHCRARDNDGQLALTEQERAKVLAAGIIHADGAWIGKGRRPRGPPRGLIALDAKVILTPPCIIISLVVLYTDILNGLNGVCMTLTSTPTRLGLTLSWTSRMRLVGYVVQDRLQRERPLPGEGGVPVLRPRPQSVRTVLEAEADLVVRELEVLLDGRVWDVVEVDVATMPVACRPPIPIP
jgi:hypothetical protein